MPEQNQTDLLLALNEGKFERVLGTSEDDAIEFKDSPYQLNVARQKWELAKDVASLANSRGGVIVIGFRTERSANQLVDTVAEHRPVPKATINWDSYRDVITHQVRPTVEGISGRWFPDDPTIDRGVFVLIVPAQSDNSKYFVVAEMQREDGTSGGALGIPIRRHEAVEWLRADVVHSLVRDGLWWRRQGSAAEVFVSSESARQSAAKQVSQRVEDIKAAAGWADTPILALHALCRPPWNRPDDFYSEGGLKGLVRDPPVLRRDGFHINTWVGPDLGPDGSLRSTTDKKALWLSQDGMLSAAARADGEFLGWYVNQGRKPGVPLALNPKCVTEYVLEFCRFFHSNIKRRGPSEWDLFLSIAGFDRDGGVVLVPSLATEGPMMAPLWHELHRASHAASTGRADLRLEAGGSSGSDAYRLMKELYAFFGQPPGEIPYVEGEEISAAQIVSKS